MSSKKSSENRHPNSVILGSILGTIFEWKVGRLPVEEQSELQYSHENIAILSQLLQYSHENIAFSLVFLVRFWSSRFFCRNMHILMRILQYLSENCNILMRILQFWLLIWSFRGLFEVSWPVKYGYSHDNIAQQSRAEQSTAEYSTAQHRHHSTAKHRKAEHIRAQQNTAELRKAGQHSRAKHSTAEHSRAQHSRAQHSNKFEYVYASELQLSARFPFHCQDRFPRYLKRGFENEVEKVSKKCL